MGDVSSRKLKRKGNDKAGKAVKKKWTPKEDAVLIAALSELCSAGWKRENGIFKSGYTAALERKLKSRLPGCNIKASPHIESRLKLLKRQYDAITEMQGAAGMHWSDKENILVCEDDNVWEDWVQIHTDAKGLRNKQFPYYNDLHILFGNRGTRKGISNEVEILVDEETTATTNLMVDDSFEDDERGNFEPFQNGSYDREVNLMTNDHSVTICGADRLIEHYKKRKVQRDVRRNASNYSILPDHERDSGRSTDSAPTNRSNEEDLLADAIIRTEKQPRGSTVKDLNKKSCNCDSKSSELGGLAKIFGTFLDRYQEHLSLLSEIVGKGTAAEKTASEKRTRLNGELTKLPNLNLQARLRAASLIVTDPAKLDFFYSLSEEERKEWVSMLLTGLV